MKKIRYLLIAIIAIGSFFIVGCGSEDDHSDKVKVTFELEKGEYKNCKFPIEHYYQKSDTNSITIYNPVTVGADTNSNQEIIRAGYEFIGWFKTKSGTEDNPTYSDLWDFATDKMTNDGITLYAGWQKIVKYRYNFCYYDENGVKQKLGYSETTPGEKLDFMDYDYYKTKRTGGVFTAIGAFHDDENETPWDPNYTHPGDESVEVDVIIKYIQGRYAVVRTKEELKANRKQNIYLDADIDLGGEEFNFEDYNHIFLGNNHTISNFKIRYSAKDEDLDEDKALRISLFGDMNNAEVRDVKFDNVQITIETEYTKTKEIYVSTIGMNVTNTKISNVTFNGKVDYTILPEGFNIEENLIIMTDKAVYQSDNTSVIENNIINNIFVGKKEE